MNYILADEPGIRKHLLPFTYTRPVCDIRIGITIIREKWEYELKSKVSSFTEEYLSKKFPFNFSPSEDNLWINGAIIPDTALANAAKALSANEALVSDNLLIAVNSGKGKLSEFSLTAITKKYSVKQYKAGKELPVVQRLWDIFSLNDKVLRQDFERLYNGKKSAKVSSTNTLLGKDIFIEEGAKLECAILNSNSGPIYIGKGAEVMEGAILKGPIALCEDSIIKAGAKIYGATTIGPHSKVGGEVNNAVIFGYSNKGHDGFLGNAVIGEWCNLGADTNNSNLKNNYSMVKMWDYAENKEVSTGLTFCGLIMSDHSKCGINTMFNTGTVVGVAANIYGGDFPKKFIPSFSWGGASGFVIHDLDKACETAERMFERRHKKFDNKEREILAYIFKLTEESRLVH
jgi:UDP-N-acetylglucosamine diphosphorylase/glucosamine-1-phosphate N-acetyltransferase